MSTLCPEPVRWRDLLDGLLPEDEQTELANHLECCDRCQEAMDALAVGTRSWSVLAGQKVEDRTPVESALCQAIACLKRGPDGEEAAWSSRQAEVPLDFLEPPSRPDQLGRLGLYEILDVIGQGGMGVVLRARDPGLNREVAIKVLAPQLATNGNARRRFAREAQAAAAVNHERIVRIHAVESSGAIPYLVMEHVAGESL
jgi:serine/threonine-protein kinase